MTSPNTLKSRLCTTQAVQQIAVVETTLADLQNQTPILTQIDTFVGSTTMPDGIPAGGKEKIFVLYEFVDQNRKNAIRR
jgi:hypothetical protein